MKLDTLITTYIIERMGFDDTLLRHLQLHKSWTSLMKHLQCEVIDDDEYNSIIHVQCYKNTLHEFNKQMDSLDDFICIKIRNIYYILETHIFNRLKAMDLTRVIQQEVLQYASVLSIKVHLI